MDILKKILFALIGVLVIIVAAGGAYLGLNGGQMNHGPNPQTAQTQQPVDTGMGNMDMSNGQPHTNQNTQPTDKAQTPNQNSQAGGTNGQQPTSGQQPQTPGQQSQTPGVGGQPGQVPPVPYPQVRMIDPDPYYDRINKAKDIIQDANKMITVDPFATAGNGTNNNTDMSKLHQGIAKMSEGMTIMEDTLDRLDKEINGEVKFAPVPDQPVYPGSYPYQGYNQQYPYGYNPQNPYNQVPAAPTPQYPNNQTTPNTSNQQTPQDSANQPINHGTTSANPLGDLSLQNILTYGAYAILIASIIGVFVAILGMVNSMFKKPNAG